MPNTTINVPHIKEREGTFTCAGGEKVDEWFRLRYLNDEEIKNIQEAEDAYLHQGLGNQQELAKQIFSEAKDKISAHPEIDYPTRIAGTSKKLFSRTNPDQEYPVYFVADENISVPHILNNNISGCPPILDVNVLAERKGENGYEVGEADINEHTLAYTECLDGSENYHIVIKNLHNGEERTTGKGYSADLAIVGNTILATRIDETMRPYMVVSLSLDGQEKETIYTETDPHKWVGFAPTIDEDWLTISSSSHDASVSFLYSIVHDSHNEATFLLYYTSPQGKGTHYSIDAHGKNLILLVDKSNGENFITDLEGNVLVPYRENHHIIDAEIIMFPSRNVPTIICTVRSQGKIRVECWEKNSCSPIGSGEQTNMGVIYLDHVDEKFIVATESWTSPECLQQVDTETWETSILQKWETPQYQENKYAWSTKNIEVRDGTLVPVSMVWNKKFENQPLPALVYVYGAYGSSLDAWWSASRTSLLDRGIMFVVVHVRGGGENGRLWHEEGRKNHKTNTMNDIIDCVSTLKKDNTVSTAVLRGGSAGGGAVAATANMADDDLFQGYIAEVPFVDVLATMSDPSLPLTVGEYEEWGNPATGEGYTNIMTWDPIRNIRNRKYPNFFIVCGLNDPRVGFWEGLKLAAKLRSVDSENIVYVRLDEGAGHFGASGRYEALKQEAEVLSFAYSCLISSEA